MIGRTDSFVLDLEHPWWYCSKCYAYFRAEKTEDLLQRVPMRNFWEGMYTTWHKDIAYPVLHSSLVKMYPQRKFPTPQDALQWRTAFEERHAILNKLDKASARNLGVCKNSIQLTD